MATDWLQAVVLGVVQGLAEFIPISSKGHLVLVPYLLGWDPPGLATTVALHFGTLVAVVVHFRTELLLMVKGVLGIDHSPAGQLHRRLAWLIVAATVPVSLVGLVLRDRLAPIFELPLPTALMLLFTAALLWLGEGWRSRRLPADAQADREPPRVVVGKRQIWDGDWVGGASETAAPAPEEPEVDAEEAAVAPHGLGRDLADPDGKDLSEVGLREAATIAGFQVLALLPGVSRSGSTIVGGMLAGLTREAAARFSFLLSIPALIGATVLSAPDMARDSELSLGPLILGIVTAGVSGYLAIRYLLLLVARDRLTGFAKYLVAASVISVLAYVMIG